MNIISVLLIYTMASAGSYMSAGIQSFMDAWPEVPQATILMVNTLPALASMPMMLFVASFVGTKIPYKTANIIGSILVVIGGLLPVFYAPSWTFVLVCRFIVGIGAGFYGMRAALLIKSCKPEDQSRYLGIGQALYSLGSMAINPIVSACIGISWRYAFLVNAFPIVFIIMTVLFMIEPAKDEPVQAASADTVAASAALDKRVILYWIMQCICTGVVYPLLSCMTIYFNDYQIGTPTQAGLALSIYTLGCAISGMLIVQMQKIFGRKAMAFGYLLTAIGQAICLFMPSVVMIYVGVFITGFGYMLAFTCITVYIGQITASSKVTMATTVLMLVNQGGIFISSYIIILAHSVFHRPTSSESAFFLNLIVQIVFMVISMLGTVVPKADEKAAS